MQHVEHDIFNTNCEKQVVISRNWYDYFLFQFQSVF
jgi:hypothetical protein